MKEKVNTKKAIGERMRILRKHLKLNQGEMASFLEIGRADLSSTERGRIYPTVFVLYLLKQKFNISLNWLLFNDGEMYYTAPVRRRENSGLNPLNEEMRDLLFHIEKIPLIRHAVLSFFFEYKARNQELIDEVLAASLEQDGK